MDCYFATVAPDVTSMPVPTAAGEFDTQVASSCAMQLQRCAH